MEKNIEKKDCAVCRELIKKIELVVFTWEVVELEALLYRHKIQGDCINEKAAA